MVGLYSKHLDKSILTLDSKEDIARSIFAGGVVVLTGAGCSTPSGIGDYRDEQGEWKRTQPVQHKDFVERIAWRRRYWARSQIGYPEFLQAQPNRAHQILAQWEAQGRLVGVITQNVDRLHQRAGSRSVIDLHGRLDQVVCLGCGQLSSRGDLQSYLERANPDVAKLSSDAVLAPDGDADLATDDFSHVHVPDCERCGGTLKPHVVFYGDSVPRPIVDNAYAWVEKAKALLVVGSSLMVFSSFRFVRRASELGTPIYAINRGVTRGDDLFQGKLDVDCIIGLETINKRLGTLSTQ